MTAGDKCSALFVRGVIIVWLDSSIIVTIKANSDYLIIENFLEVEKKNIFFPDKLKCIAKECK